MGEGTFAGASGNDEDAPRAAIRVIVVEPSNSTHRYLSALARNCSEQTRDSRGRKIGCVGSSA